MALRAIRESHCAALEHIALRVVPVVKADALGSLSLHGERRSRALVDVRAGLEDIGDLGVLGKRAYPQEAVLGVGGVRHLRKRHGDATGLGRRGALVGLDVLIKSERKRKLPDAQGNSGCTRQRRAGLKTIEALVVPVAVGRVHEQDIRPRCASVPPVGDVGGGGVEVNIGTAGGIYLIMITRVGLATLGDSLLILVPITVRAHAVDSQYIRGEIAPMRGAKQAKATRGGRALLRKHLERIVLVDGIHDNQGRHDALAEACAHESTRALRVLHAGCGRFDADALADTGGRGNPARRIAASAEAPAALVAGRAIRVGDAGKQTIIRTRRAPVEIICDDVLVGPRGKRVGNKICGVIIVALGRHVGHSAYGVEAGIIGNTLSIPRPRELTSRRRAGPVCPARRSCMINPIHSVILQGIIRRPRAIAHGVEAVGLEPPDVRAAQGAEVVGVD